MIVINAQNSYIYIIHIYSELAEQGNGLKDSPSIRLRPLTSTEKVMLAEDIST